MGENIVTLSNIMKMKSDSTKQIRLVSVVICHAIITRFYHWLYRRAELETAIIHGF